MKWYARAWEFIRSGKAFVFALYVINFMAVIFMLAHIFIYATVSPVLAITTLPQFFAGVFMAYLAVFVWDRNKKIVPIFISTFGAVMFAIAAL